MAMFGNQIQNELYETLDREFADSNLSAIDFIVLILEVVHIWISYYKTTD